jgi:hypothetical protein
MAMGPWTYPVNCKCQYFSTLSQHWDYMWYWYGHVEGFDERVGMATYDPNRDKAIGTSETKQKLKR